MRHQAANPAVVTAALMALVTLSCNDDKNVAIAKEGGIEVRQGFLKP